jgi:hypothetical protein
MKEVGSTRRQEDHMAPTLSFSRRIGLSAACIGALVAMPQAVRAQTPAPEVAQQSMSVQMHSVGEQLGAKLNPEQPAELRVGGTLNGTLQDPDRLERFGLTGLHKGARVTAMRVAPQKVLVEVDELDPQPITRKATLKIDGSGRLSAP